MAEFLMPKLGADMTAGTLVAWHKKPGDVVRRGDVIADVETDKGVIGIEIFMDGTIDRLLIPPGEKVPVGKPLAAILEIGPTPTTVSAPAIPEVPPLPPPQTMTREPAPSVAIHRQRISPSARALAQKLGIDPTGLRGSGPGGAITREDIEGAAKTPPSTASRGIDAARMRQTIAAAMSRSKREIPHYYLSTTIDMHSAVTWLAEENLRRSVTERMLYGVLLLKASALALREVPELNATWDGQQSVLNRDIHIGTAISLRQGGLIAPALHHTDQLSLTDLMVKFRGLVNRARAGSLRSSELSDPTITVTSLGDQGIETVFPIIYPPQVAIVGFGKVVERPWVVQGQIVARPVITATLAADHRVSDGHRGGLFLAAIDRLLQEPSKL
jgi:pyruvate dehydrogenase E2 component (dihydrolipoamide acetyltransferase)